MHYPDSLYMDKTTFFEQQNQFIKCFISKIKSKNMVIKPTKTIVSEGLCLVNRSDAHDTISRIMNDESNDKFWKKSPDKSLLLQSCVSSKLIKWNGKTYCPTGKVIYAINDNNVTHLASYWKLPDNPLDETSDLNNDQMNQIAKYESSAIMSESDILKINSILDPVVVKMLKHFNVIS